MADWGDVPAPFDQPQVQPSQQPSILALLGAQGPRSERARDRKPQKNKKRMQEVPRAEAQANVADGVQRDADGAGGAQREGDAKKPKKVAPKPEFVLAKLDDAAHEFHVDRKHLRCSNDGDLLWCNVCGASFGTRKNVWSKHLSGEKHKKKRAKVEAAAAAPVKQVSLEETARMQEAGRVAVEKKRRLDEAVLRHRKRVMKAMMASGIPISSLSADLIELLSEPREFRMSLGDVSNLMREFGSELAAEALEEDRAALAGHNVAFCFDSTPARDDIGIVVARTCSADFSIRHRLVAVKQFEKSLKAENVTRLVDETREQLRVPRSNFVVGLSDGCNVMMAVARTLKDVYPRYSHAFCLSHALAKVLPRFQLELLDRYSAHYNLTFKNSFSARSVFLKHTGMSWKRKHKIRWNASHVQHKQQLDAWDNMTTILTEMDKSKLCSETMYGLKGMFDNNHLKSSDLYWQLVAAVEGADPFVRATAFLEGDGFLAPYVWPRLTQLRVFIDSILKSPVVTLSMPRLHQLFASWTEVARKKVWFDVQRCLKPGLEYLYQLARGEEVGDSVRYGDAVLLFRFASLLDPSNADMKTDGFQIAPRFVTVVQEFLGEPLVEGMIRDFPLLVAAYTATGAPSLKPEELLQWWKEHGSLTGAWARGAQLFALLQPSSALAERAGAILRSRISEQQGNMLEQTQELYCKQAYSEAEAKGKKQKEK